MSKPFAWSFTALDCYVTCPRKYYGERVAKEVPFVESEAMKRGNAIHEALHMYSIGKKPWPDEYPQKWALLADALKQKKGSKLYEIEMPISADKRPCKEWWGKDVWCRLKQDVVMLSPDQTEARAVDWKTGKFKDFSRREIDQLVLAGLIIMIFYPTVEVVESAYVWLDAGEAPTKRVVTRDTAEQHWRPFEEKVEQVQESLATNTWPMRPSGLCKEWCDVLSCPKNGRHKK